MKYGNNAKVNEINQKILWTVKMKIWLFKTVFFNVYYNSLFMKFLFILIFSQKFNSFVFHLANELICEKNFSFDGENLNSKLFFLLFASLLSSKGPSAVARTGVCWRESDGQRLCYKVASLPVHETRVKIQNLGPIPNNIYRVSCLTILSYRWWKISFF